MLLSFFQWAENTSWSVGIRESTTLFPAIICVHAMALAISVGLIVALDIRLLGWGMRKTPVSVIFEQLRAPWALIGFVIMMVSGLLLFWSEPVKCYKTGSFNLKMIFMALAGVNALIFDRRIYPTVAAWDTATVMPRAAWWAGASSLALWFGVIFTGRWTAYF